MKAIAYRTGMNAFMEGKSIYSNPYTDISFAEMFDQGFEDARVEFEATHADLDENEPLRILSDSSWALR